jgi:L-serine dehydratase
MPAISIFDIFKIGVGPSSSHTVGPMKAARAFVADLARDKLPLSRIQVRLHGSLAYTGKGHGTDSAVLLGLSGAEPATLDPDTVEDSLRTIHKQKKLEVPLLGIIDFDPERDLQFDYDRELPRHTNGMHFEAHDSSGKLLREEDWYSLGGGFVVRGDEPETANQEGEPPYPFRNAAELLQLADQEGLSIAELVLRNEQHWRGDEEIEQRMRDIWRAMQDCVQRGLKTEGVLPGRMMVVRRAPKLYQRLRDKGERLGLDTMDWVNAFAIAVNEENAAGGRVVTSPTNGAAGVIPAVMHYYSGCARSRRLSRFLLGPFGARPRRGAVPLGRGWPVW